MSEETQAQLPSPADEKARLECEKLRAEIQAIGKPLVKTPGFYSAFAPVALAILGLVFTWATGWFDVQRTRVSNEKTLLEAQTERLRTERTTLEAQGRQQQAIVTRAEEETRRLKEREAKLTNQVTRLDRERAELVAAKEFLENETKRLAGSDSKASQFLEQLKFLHTTREQMAGDLQMLNASNATLRTVSARQAALIRWANRVLSEGWSIALKDKSTWAKFRDFGGHVMEVGIASIPYLPEWQIEPDPTPGSNEAAAKAYDEAQRKEFERILRQASKKTLDDYLREAGERFQLLGGETVDNAATNQPTKP